MPTSTPNNSWNCSRLSAWLVATSPMPSSTTPSSTTGRVPQRSLSQPQPNAEAPITRNTRVPAPDTPVRDHPVSADIGCRKTASEKQAPIDTQEISIPAATITQPYATLMCLLPGRIAAGWICAQPHARRLR